MVFYFHTCANPQLLPLRWRLLAGMGWAGVDLFFVLSGYLITNILLQTRNSINYYSTFYIRRALRIFPVYYLALIVVLLVQPIIYSHLHAGIYPFASSFHQQVWYWLNLSNLRSAFYPVEIPLASLYWSLAIEEQFYLVWPSLVRTLDDHAIRRICIVGIATSLLLRCLPVVQAYNVVHDNFIYRLTPFRLDGLLMGCLLAVYLSGRPSLDHLRKLTLLAFVSGSAVILIASNWFTQPTSVAMSKYGYTGLALLFASLVTICVEPRNKFERTVTLLFSWPLLRNFGKYSYFIYVFHLLILYSLGHVLERLTQPFSAVPAVYISALIALAICYAVAAFSWQVFESPFLKLKRQFPYRDRAHE